MQRGKKKDRVLAVGEVRIALSVRPGMTPERNYRRNRMEWAIKERILGVVPRRLRAARPLRRFYWQQAEVDAIQKRAAELADWGPRPRAPRIEWRGHDQPGGMRPGDAWVDGDGVRWVMTTAGDLVPDPAVVQRAVDSLFRTLDEED